VRILAAPPAIALAAVLLTGAGCSLLAPSDAELMGGNKGGDGGGSTASDASHGEGAAADAPGVGVDGATGDDATAPESGGSCGNIGDNCASSGDCCSGLACEPNSGTCVTCDPAGTQCWGQGDTCCSGQCYGHQCQ
jgi:hypothetical protein